jgi:hypothetical protein
MNGAKIKSIFTFVLNVSLNADFYKVKVDEQSLSKLRHKSKA